MENSINPPEPNPYASPDALDPPEPVDEPEVVEFNHVIATALIGAAIAPTLFWLMGDFPNAGWIPSEIPWGTLLLFRTDQALGGAMTAVAGLVLFSHWRRRQWLPPSPGHWMTLAWSLGLIYGLIATTQPYEAEIQAVFEIAYYGLNVVLWVGLCVLAKESRTWRLYVITSMIWAVSLAIWDVTGLGYSELESPTITQLRNWSSFSSTIFSVAVLFFSMLGITLDVLDRRQRDVFHKTAIALSSAKVVTCFIVQHQ
jgi:hypothetical protein